MLTRGALVVAVGAVLASFGGPLLLTRWERILESQPVAAGFVWAVAIAAAIVGTGWILSIGWRSRENGRADWRSRRR